MGKTSCSRVYLKGKGGGFKKFRVIASHTTPRPKSGSRLGFNDNKYIKNKKSDNGVVRKGTQGVLASMEKPRRVATGLD